MALNTIEWFLSVVLHRLRAGRLGIQPSFHPPRDLHRRHAQNRRHFHHGANRRTLNPAFDEADIGSGRAGGRGVLR